MPRATTWEATAMRGLHTATKSSLHSLQLEKAWVQQGRPSTAKNKLKTIFLSVSWKVTNCFHSIYITFTKWRNYRDRKQVSGSNGIELYTHKQKWMHINTGKRLLGLQSSQYCTNVNFLLLILYYNHIRCHHWEKLREGFIDSMYNFCNLLWVNYFKVKSFILESHLKNKKGIKYVKSVSKMFCFLPSDSSDNLKAY